MKVVFCLLQTINASNNNQKSNIKLLEKNRNYEGFCAGYSIMNIKDLNEVIEKNTKIMSVCSKFSNTIFQRKNKHFPIQRVCRSLKNMLNDSSLLNQFERMKLKMDIDFLNANADGGSHNNLKAFVDWVDYRRKFSRHISRVLFSYQVVLKDFNKLFLGKTGKPDDALISKMRPAFYFDNLLVMLMNYAELISVKDSFERDNNMEPAKIYIKSLLKTLAGDKPILDSANLNESLLTAREVLRDDGSIPNNIDDFLNTAVSAEDPANDFPSIVVDELKYIELNDDKTIKEVIDNIYRRFNALLGQYNSWMIKKCKNIANVGCRRRYIVLISICNSLKSYLSDDVCNSVNRNVKKNNVDTEPYICAIDSIQRIFDDSDTMFSVVYETNPTDLRKKGEKERNSSSKNPKLF